MDKKRVLIFPAGAENALEIYDSLRYNVNVEVFGASGKMDFAEYQYDKEHYIEGDFYYKNPEFIDEFNGVIKKYAIDVVIPTHDDLALFLAENREKFDAKILVADAETARICRSKQQTYEVFSAETFCPVLYKNISEIKPGDYPLFYKPDKASGAVGTHVIACEDELESALFSNEGILCKYLPGTELTVDCFTNRRGKLLFAGARTRDRIVHGIAYRSTTVKLSDEIYNIAEIINKKLSFFGAWYFQVRQDEDCKYKLLEISCRQASGMNLYRHKGINFPMLGIFELFGVDTSFVMLDFEIQMERRLSARFRFDLYYETVYIDFDDTLVVNDRVCPVTIQFLFQCIDEGKRIVLLTRHEGELGEILSKHRLSEGLFDKIIHITFDEDKTDFIKPDNTILIDNSFAERKLISDRFSIPVFDVDMIDMLLKK
jgi:hypothetical protein